MSSRKRITTAVAGVLAFMMIAGVALAARGTSTYFYSATAKNGTIDASVQVCPTDGGEGCVSEGEVKVSLWKLKNGTWVKLQVKPAETDGYLWYVTFKGAPQRGKCKMVARFTGTEQFDPSKGSIKSACNDSDWRR